MYRRADEFKWKVQLMVLSSFSYCKLSTLRHYHMILARFSSQSCPPPHLPPTHLPTFQMGFSFWLTWSAAVLQLHPSGPLWSPQCSFSQNIWSKVKRVQLEHSCSVFIIINCFLLRDAILWSILESEANPTSRLARCSFHSIFSKSAK